jgi:hypothetical protein
MLKPNLFNPRLTAPTAAIAARPLKCIAPVTVLFLKGILFVASAFMWSAPAAFLLKNTLRVRVAVIVNTPTAERARPEIALAAPLKRIEPATVRLKYAAVLDPAPVMCKFPLTVRFAISLRVSVALMRIAPDTSLPTRNMPLPTPVNLKEPETARKNRAFLVKAPVNLKAPAIGRLKCAKVLLPVPVICRLPAFVRLNRTTRVNVAVIYMAPATAF